MSDCILLVDDDVAVTEGLAMLLERPGRTVVVCSDVESAEITLERYPVTHLVTDVQFSGAFGFEGLHFLSRVHAHRPDCRIVLMTGFASDALCAEGLRIGASAVLAKPFDVEELEAVLGATERSDEPSRRVDVQSIDRILRADALSAYFQPIVHLDGVEHPFAFEALARVNGGWAAGGAAELFTYASRCAKLTDLNLSSIGNALAETKLLPPAAQLFLNVDPAVLEAPAFADRFLGAASNARVDLRRIVVEITERTGFTSEANAASVFEDLRAAGIRFALDDVGSAYSHLPLVNRIQPSFLKISMTFGLGSERDETKRRIVRNLVSLARDFNCRTILEGIECRATADAAVDFGIDYGQGFLFGRPEPAIHWNEDHSVRACA
jgi:EAL domain-containing protein (putative c-di-GMP-specific phosphodiesterase class I)